MKITEEKIYLEKENININLYTLINDNDLKIKISNLGASITNIYQKDKNNQHKDIVLGYDQISDYLNNPAYFGVIVGRYANRISKGKFNIDNKDYQLKINNGNNHIHGGIKGFSKLLWDSSIIKEDDSIGVNLELESMDGDEGYPGTLKVNVQYKLNNNNELIIKYYAVTDKPTPINLTQHSYFNLNSDNRNILNHSVQIDSDEYIEVNEEQIPTGKSVKVDKTDMDLRNLTEVNQKIDNIAGGYDHTYVLNNNVLNKLSAKIYEKNSGRIVEMYTTEPGVQFYTGNFLDGSITGKNKTIYKKHYGLCLEAQHYPDSPNQPNFPNTILNPGDKYEQTTIYKFITD